MPVQDKLTTSVQAWGGVLSTVFARIENARNTIGTNMTAEQLANQRNSLQTALDELQGVRALISTAYSDLAVVKEQTETRKVDAELTKTLIEAWPPSVSLDRLSYLGAGLLAVGSGTFVFAAQLPFPLNALPSAVLWTVGMTFVILSLYGLRRYDLQRLRYFRERTGLSPPKVEYWVALRLLVGAAKTGFVRVRTRLFHPTK